MNSKIVAIFLALPMGAMCTDPTTCALSYMKYKSADMCCENDPLKCNPTTTVTCPTGKYRDVLKHGTTVGSDAAAACCTPVATCNDVTCGTSTTLGTAYKQKSGATNTTKCAAAAMLCGGGDADTCCVLDADKCGGQADSAKTCDSGKYWDDTKANMAVGGAPKTNCCTPVGTCDAVTCFQPFKKKSGVTNTTKCPGSVSLCSIQASPCCESDNTICASMTDSDCGTGKVINTAVASSTARGSDAVATCCKTAPAATHAPLCAGGTTLTSGAVELQWKAMNVIVAIGAAALWK